MAKSKLVKANQKIAEDVVGGYKKIEESVVESYKTIENGAVRAFNKVADRFVDQYLTRDGETVAEARERLAKEHGEQQAPLSLADAIRDRLENGFANWNGGYDGWLKWCNTLYEPDAHYNVYGQRLTLEQYKEMMGKLFEHYTMALGAFDNMLIQDDWAAIRYTVKVKNLDSGEEFLQNTMEFVHFKENPAPIGVRVIEGWALADSPLSAEH